MLFDAASQSQAFLLPEVCNLPFGFYWSTGTGYDDFAASICAALGCKSALPFMTVLQALKQQLGPWFPAVKASPDTFQILVCHFLPFYDDHFFNIDSGKWLTATDPDAFSPMIDMLNGFVWQLWCAHQSTTATVMNQN
jgi:hypothetical protein